jgi:hypothetical protein
LVSPEYDTVIELEPTLTAEVVVLAVPLLSNVTGCPIAVVPLKNVTVPVGVPVPGLAAVTVAFRVTDAPEADGLGTTVTAEVVLAFVTVTVTPVELLAAKVVSPE